MGIEDLAGKVEFVLAFAVVHEMPSAAELSLAAGAGLHVKGRPAIRRSLTALLEKT
ncbi:MAG TPA: hypothetical protein VHA11_05315 [Bryobacteraceae bacterium]|nr:hypothetical protein [Bryobacteraceae bacterium]